ncbi:hypothetical protein F4814DRAFT_452301 [Daldinia grandis]|nr:hypothetical protein F4814DRAFT_452301 [Daldinia grandis]
MGYWDTNQIEESSLLDVLSRLRRHYVDMMSNEYPAVLSLYTTSLLQETRAWNVRDEKLRIDIFFKKDERNLVISLSAEVIALSFATDATLASFGFLGLVAIALTTAEALGLGATPIAAGILFVLDGLNLRDIVALIGLLQSTKRGLNALYEGLRTIRPLLNSVLGAAEGMESIVTKMVDRLEGT